MLRVGLTGSIGVGKSYVVSVLAELGCHVIDADQIARDVVEPGSEGLSSLKEKFGDAILTADGTLDRQRLGQIVFADEQKRQLLNSVLHPFIIARQDELLRQWERDDPGGIGIVDAALMIESGGYKRFDKLIVVHCRPEIQLDRLMSRNGLSRTAALQRINSQLSQEEKLKFADYRIDTSEGFDSTRKQTETIHGQLLRLAKGES